MLLGNRLLDRLWNALINSRIYLFLRDRHNGLQAQGLHRSTGGIYIGYGLRLAREEAEEVGVGAQNQSVLVAEDFWIRLQASQEGEEATFSRTELSDGDDARICDGSIFRWVIGYERSPAGTKKRVSQIVFRDLPAVTRSDLRDGEAWAREMAESLSP